MRTRTLWIFLMALLLGTRVFGGLALDATQVQAQLGDNAAVTKETLDTVDPLKIGGGQKLFEGTKAIETPSQAFTERPTVATLINRFWQFAFPIAGFILFVMLVWGGFEMVIGAANSKSQDQGRQRATAAIVGFLLLFSSYWLIQIVEYVFKVSILGT